MLPRPWSILGLWKTQGPPLHDIVRPRHTHTVSSLLTLQAAAPTLPPRQNNLWGQSTICNSRWQFPNHITNRQKIHPRSNQNVSILRPRHWRHNATSTGIARNPAGSTNRKHNDTCKTISWICRNSPWRNHNIPRLIHGPIGPQQHLLHFRVKSKKSGRRPFYHVKQLTHSSKQWSHRHHLSDHQISNVLCSGRGTGISLHQLQGGHPGTPRPQVNGTQTASHADANQQHKCPRVVTNNIASKRLKSMDMKLNWLRCRKKMQWLRQMKI